MAVRRACIFICMYIKSSFSQRIQYTSSRILRARRHLTVDHCRVFIGMKLKIFIYKDGQIVVNRYSAIQGALHLDANTMYSNIDICTESDISLIKYL